MISGIVHWLDVWRDCHFVWKWRMLYLLAKSLHTNIEKAWLPCSQHPPCWSQWLRLSFKWGICWACHHVASRIFNRSITSQTEPSQFTACTFLTSSTKWPWTFGHCTLCNSVIPYHTSWMHFSKNGNGFFRNWKVYWSSRWICVMHALDHCIGHWWSEVGEELMIENRTLIR